MSFFVILLIAVSLSMDAFSLSLAYGTLKLNKKDMLILSIIVAIYHFFMPIFGMLIGASLIDLLPIKPNVLVFIILTIIGIQMIIETFKDDKKIQTMNFSRLLIFGLAVSIDSFSVGIGLKMISDNFIFSALVFSISSFIFTFSGLFLGKKINQLIGKISTLIGGVILIIIGLLYLL